MEQTKRKQRRKQPNYKTKQQENRFNNQEIKQDTKKSETGIAVPVKQPEKVKTIVMNKKSILVPVEFAFSKGSEYVKERFKVREQVLKELDQNIKNKDIISFLAFKEDKTINLVINLTDLIYYRRLDSWKQKM